MPRHNPGAHDRAPRRRATTTTVLMPAVVLLALLVVFTPGLVAQDGEQAEHLEGWYRGLRDLAPDPARGASVSGVVLERDAGTFFFDDGVLHALDDIDGRTVGAVFVGDGRFELTPPDPVEVAQLRRVLETDAVSEPLESVVLLFTDFTWSELEQQLDVGPIEPSNRAKDRAEDARDYFTSGDGWVSRRVLLPMANADIGFFYAHMDLKDGDPLIFAIDEHDAEEITLSTKADRVDAAETVAQFHRAADYATGRSLPQEALDLVAVHDYDIHTRIEGNLDIKGRARVGVTHLNPDQRWIPFRLFFELEVDSVRWEDGSTAGWYRPDESSDVWIDFATAPAQQSALVFHYEGDMLDRPQGLWVQIGSHMNWYPVYEYWRDASYRMTFDAPDDFELTAVGTRTSFVEDDGRKVSTFEAESVGSATFNLGDFDVYESEPPSPGEPALSVLLNESAHRRLADAYMQRGLLVLEQENMAEMVAHDLRNAFTFFNEVYGPSTVNDFVAAEIPYNHGEAYEGLVMLAWSTFQWTSSEGFDEMFRAHEVAHQWWGIGVRPATYRDRWLAEGFSEFSGLWYAARAKGSVDMYYDRLEQTRERLLDRRGEAAPIALGTRAGSSRYPADYSLTVYQKSAWVLHMLRTLMTDYDTGSDDAFTNVMRRFYTEHLGGMATTGGFQAIVEEELSGSMDWFFRQWVYGSDIPTYTFAHRYHTNDAGQVVATVRVRQEDVPPDFQMYVPVHLDFGDEGSATVRILVSGPETVLELPLLPREPNSITFNPFESVLAETKTEDWNE